ncbi:MAG: hypothetical protein HS117_19460 [Verrucomicrobiaceae bacterium]|nr:hypothetical protein [Verrucomicrobiaceae bacterium]
METTDEQLRLEDLRAAVLTALYRRRHGAHRADSIANIFLPPGLNAKAREVEMVLADLERFHWVEAAFEAEHSSIKVWQITGAGITHVERRGK